MGFRESCEMDQEGCEAFLEELVRGKRIDMPALGIARQAIHQGISSLSDKQWAAMEAQVDEYFRDTCDRCGQDMPFSEMLFAYDESAGMCRWCYQVTRKDD